MQEKISIRDVQAKSRESRPAALRHHLPAAAGLPVAAEYCESPAFMILIQRLQPSKTEKENQKSTNTLWRIEE